jgi:hypothetical protein
MSEESLKIQVPHEMISFGGNTQREVNKNTFYFEKTLNGSLQQVMESSHRTDNIEP